MNNGFVFIGRIAGGYVSAEVFFDGASVSVCGPLWFTLDQWQRLRELCPENDGENPLWATTPVEYEKSLGEPAPAAGAGGEPA